MTFMLNELFKAANINNIEVIDDAFDTAPNIALSAEQVTAFLDGLSEADYSLVQEISGVEGYDELADNLATIEGTLALFGRIGDLQDKTHRAKVFSEFDNDVSTSLALLNPLLEVLEESEAAVRKSGSAYEVQAFAPDIIFIDLKISHGTDIDVNVAVSIIKNIKLHHPQSTPIIFLMSSIPLALHEKRDIFRESCELYASQFEKLNKSMFSRKRELQRMISDYASVYPAIRSVRGYHAAWSTAIRDAAERFETRLRDLDVADYMALKDISLAHEESGIGAYLTEVLMEYYLYELQGSSQVHELATEIDRWSRTNIRSSFNINKAAETVYLSNIVFNPALLAAEKVAGLDYIAGKFNLGDVFLFRDPESLSLTRAVAVMSPACDLARYDHSEPDSVNILLCEGALSRFTEDVPIRNLKSDSAVGPLIIEYGEGDDKASYLVNWNVKRPLSWSAAEVKTIVAGTTPWCFAARMRTLYAIQLQRAMTNDLSRVGVQVAPSIYQPHGITMYCRIKDDWVQLSDEWASNNSAAAITDDKPAKKILFKIRGGVLAQLMNKLDCWVDEHADEDGAADLKMLLSDENVYLGLQHLYMKRMQEPEKNKTFRYPIKQLQLKGASAKASKEVLAFVRESDSFDPEQKVVDGEPAYVVVLFKPLRNT